MKNNVFVASYVNDLLLVGNYAAIESVIQYFKKEEFDLKITYSEK